MFDPTVFDNLKVVIEGDLYELDLEGHMKIVDRKDLIDLAALSRSFKMKMTVNDEVFGEIILSSDLENIAGELLQQNDRPGCTVSLSFYKYMERSADVNRAIHHWKNELTTVWGQERNISLYSILKYDSNEKNALKAEIMFERLIHEDNIDDLREMLTYLVDTLS
jgi:hypothetical protein